MRRTVFISILLLASCFTLSGAEFKLTDGGKAVSGAVELPPFGVLALREPRQGG